MAKQRWRVGGAVAVTGLALLVACSRDGGDPLASNLAGVWNGPSSGGAALSGRVALFRSFPDSAQIPLTGVPVVLERIKSVDTVPDTTGGPPPDTTGGGRGPGTCPIAMFCQGGPITPADTVIGPPPPPPPPPPIDSVPPDSTPPPPPPGRCGVAGEVVGTVRTDQKGRFTFRGLQAGRYNIIAKPDLSNVLVSNLCGFLVTSRQNIDGITIAVIPVPAPGSPVTNTGSR